MIGNGFYIDGVWREPADGERHPVENPATQEAFASTAWATREEVDDAVMAARRAFAAWSVTTPAARQTLLRRIAHVYESRMEEMAHVISQEMGAPIGMALSAQAASGLSHVRAFADALEELPLEQQLKPYSSAYRIIREPVGVAALITPWNWPMNQICLKVGAALAAGCTMVLKPSEITPLSAVLFARIVEEAGTPPGVFNLVLGDGKEVGPTLVTHPEVDVVSFTGSTRAGIEISRASAASIKRVSLELGGKSPNIVFADADMSGAVEASIRFCFKNTGQSCDAPARMLVERPVYDRVVELAASIARGTGIDLPEKPGDHIGPLVSGGQYTKVQKLIEAGIAQGARLVAGGTGRPVGFSRGWFVQPTVFSDVTSDMTIWCDEIFGPVLAIAPFDTEDEAVLEANNTLYGLAAYVQTTDSERARRVTRRLRAGVVDINGASRAQGAPFGGYRMSGNGREGGLWGIEEFLEVKSVSGW